MAVILDPNVYDIGVREGVGPLENGDLVVLVLDDAYVYDPEDATVADLVGNEVSGGAYARETITATVDRIGDVWGAFADSTPSFDLTGITRGGFVVARDGATDADRKLVRWFPDPAGPEVSAEPSWPDGILQARIDTGEAAGGGVQSVTGTAVDDTDPANPVIDLSGVQTIVAGTGISVDDTDPAHPIISAIGGGGGGGVPIGVATTIVSGSSSPIFHNVSGDIDTDTGVLVVTPPDDTEHPGDLTIVLTGLPDGPRAPLTVYMPVDGSRWHQLQVGEVDLISTGAVGYVSTTVTWIGEGEMRALRPSGADSAPYRPDNDSNWASSPSRVSYALDELAARIKALEP